MTLWCRQCGRSKRVALDPTDPEGTATVVVACPECAGSGECETVYYDARGERI